MPLSDDRLYNILLDILASQSKNSATNEASSQDVAKWAKATYDLPPLIETRLAWFLSELKIHKSDSSEVAREHREDIDERINEFLRQAAADRKEALDAIIAIRSATAVASNDAGDAARAANDAARAASRTEARADETGKRNLLTAAEGEKSSDSIVGVARDLLRGLPAWARFTIAVLALVATLFGGQAIEARWKWLSGGQSHHERKAEP